LSSTTMRGEYCIGFASVLSFTSLMLLIFTHVGQINTSKVPRGISMVNLNTTAYGPALSDDFDNPVPGLYATNASAPLEAQAGLRLLYKFGLYSYCGYLEGSNGTCTNHTAGAKFEPYQAILSDMTPQYSEYTVAIIGTSQFADSTYFGNSSRAAYCMILIGTILTALAMFCGFITHTVTYLVAAIMAVLASIFLLIGAAIWTALIKKAETINSNAFLPPHSAPIPLGLVVSTGEGLYLLWAAFACTFASAVPYLLSTCTYRG